MEMLSDLQIKKDQGQSRKKRQLTKSCVPLGADVWSNSFPDFHTSQNNKRGSTVMNQQTIVEPALSDAMSSVQGMMHDGMTQMNSAAKGIVHTFFDISVQAMQQYQRLTEQNLDFCSDMQDAFLKQAQQIRETNLKLWASMPMGEWAETGRSTRN
jgi:hypothetical protein